LPYGRLRHHKAELEQFAMNVWCTPKPIVHAHPPDQRPQFRSDLRPASLGAGFPAPVTGKSSAMPAHDGLRPQDYYGLENRRAPTIKLDEEQAIPSVNWTRPRTLRCSTITWRLSTAFSASSRLLGLKGEATRFNRKNISAIIAADVRRFGHPIKRTWFSAHTATRKRAGGLSRRWMT